ncbi:MAG TPA: recombinase A [Candidatus Binatia bacterium]|jgi:recombination protein RecA
MASSSIQKLRPVVLPKTPWTLGEVAGRLVEISGSTACAALTLTFVLIREAQERGEPVGWVTMSETSFYPPDAAQNGADLATLVVVRLSHAENIARSGEKLLRSGGFGIVVLDLGVADIPMPLQTRLTGLAHRHHTALICLTEKESRAFSLGSLVSLRAHAEKRRAENNRFACTLRVLKDKRRGPTWHYEELYTGPAGLC